MHPIRWFLAALVVGTVLVAVPFVRDGGGGAGAVSTVLGGSPAATEPVVASRSKGAPTGLDPGLVAAYEAARADAEEAGHDLVINSGFRTPERQQELLDEEIAERGSYEEATLWVFPPDRSMHVQGLAIDVGDRGAAAWLQDHGARYGLCHTLAWEWWHFEWRSRWQDAAACPPEAQDPSQAPPR